MSDPFEIAAAAYDLDADHRRNIEDMFSALSSAGWVLVQWPGPLPTVSIRDTVNAVLHNGLGIEEPCATACTHVIAGSWTVLGVANVIGRADARDSARRPSPPGTTGDGGE